MYKKKLTPKKMRKIIQVFLIVSLSLTLASLAFAGGGGPPKNFKKGVFLEVDPAAGTAVFRLSGSEETMRVRFDESVKTEEHKRGFDWRAPPINGSTKWTWYKRSYRR